LGNTGTRDNLRCRAPPGLAARFFYVIEELEARVGIEPPLAIENT
jgi:hypothetical protein